MHPLSTIKDERRWLLSFLAYSGLTVACLVAVGIIIAIGAYFFFGRSSAVGQQARPFSDFHDVRPNLHLAPETVGFESIVTTVVNAFDSVDVIALGENHMRKADSAPGLSGQS
jgi:hypothetical protein